LELLLAVRFGGSGLSILAVILTFGFGAGLDGGLVIGLPSSPLNETQNSNWVISDIEVLYTSPKIHPFQIILNLQTHRSFQTKPILLSFFVFHDSSTPVASYLRCLRTFFSHKPSCDADKKNVRLGYTRKS